MDPTSVAGYRVVEKIGRGGMGVVYRARDSVLDRDVALKYVGSAGGPDGHVERLIREAKIASSLQHPGIVTIYGFVGEGPCIAMEYIRGDTLSAHLLPDGMALDKAVRLGLQIAEALHYAHQSGVVHADLKPSNIMIDLAGRAKVLDFGLAHWRLFEELQTVSDSGEHLQQLAGTIPYMSPELVMGRPIDCRSDIFSFGCVLFEILTGQRPFSADNPAATLNCLLNRMPEGIEILRRKVPTTLADLILRMLEKDPNHRLSALGDVIALLRDLCSDAEVSGQGKKRRIFPLFGRRRWLSLLFTVLMGALLYLISGPGISERQLRVFIAQPEYYRTGKGSPLDAVIWSSVVNGLHLLGSVQSVLYHQSPVDNSNPSQLAKLAGSDEWINIMFQPENPLANVRLQRIHTKNGFLVRQKQFSIPKRYTEQSAQAVLSQVLALYNDKEPIGSSSYTHLSFDNYQKFSDIYSDLYNGVGDRQDLFKDLDLLIDESAVFPAAELLAVDLAYDLFTDTDDFHYLNIAAEFLNRLRSYHANSELILQREAKLAIARNDGKRAESLLDSLVEISPGDPAVLLLRSRLAELHGDFMTAKNLIEEASIIISLPLGERHRAADLAIRSGDVNTARAYISDVLRLTPGNTTALGKSGLLELLYGDVDKAIDTYSKLLVRKQHRSYYVNLGLAFMLKGKYHKARMQFTRALELQPGSGLVMLNLADVEMALGNRERALELYREIIENYQLSENINASDKMIKAQCFAHLGQYGPAIENTLEVLIRLPDDPEIAYQAALVYSLVGEKESALVNAKKALRGGIDVRWFRLPVFANTSIPYLVRK